MLQIYFRIGAGLIAVILAVGGFIGMEGISDSNDEVATIPPCSYDPGLPGWLGDDEVTCYWGMSGDVLTIPEEAVAADVDVVGRHCFGCHGPGASSTGGGTRIHGQGP